MSGVCVCSGGEGGGEREREREGRGGGSRLVSFLYAARKMVIPCRKFVYTKVKGIFSHFELLWSTQDNVINVIFLYLQR